MKPAIRHDPISPALANRRRGRSPRDVWRDERGEIDALDVALLGLMIGAVTVALGGPAELLVAAEKMLRAWADWIG